MNNKEYKVVEELHFLGLLCKNGHDHENTGHSLRNRSNGACAQCNKEYQREYYAKNRETKLAQMGERYQQDRERRLEYQRAYYAKKRALQVEKNRDVYL